MSKWRPIETAPAGEMVLVAHAGMQWVRPAELHEGEGWYETNNYPTDTWGGQMHPTHWMPMPDPPIRADASTGGETRNHE